MSVTYIPVLLFLAEQVWEFPDFLKKKIIYDFFLLFLDIFLEML